MLVVLPFYSGDAHRLVKLLEWIALMDRESLQHHSALLWCPFGTQVKEMNDLALKSFGSSSWAGYDEIGGAYPQPHNHAWQSAARHIASNEKLGPWLWLESDAVPTKPGWLDILENAHKVGGKPFSGHVVGEQHMTGVGIYPNVIYGHIQNALLTRSKPFDIVAGVLDDVLPKVHRINDLIQHTPDVDHHFNNQADVDAIVHPEAVLFHKCKDGSLIEILSNKKISPKVRPKCLIQLSRAGDIINILPIAYDMFQKTGNRTAIAVHKDFAGVLGGVTYAAPLVWNGVMDDVHGASAMALNAGYDPVISKVNGLNWSESRTKKSASYCLDSWRLAGYDGKWGSIPTVFDNRDNKRESALIAGVMGEKKNVVLFAGIGISSPWSGSSEALSFLQSRFDVISLDDRRTPHISDLLGLIDRAACLVSVDTMFLHLARASRTPVIAFTADKNSWLGTPPSTNTVARIPYNEGIKRLPEVADIIAKIIGGNRVVRVRRSAAIGDVIMASGIVKKMKRDGQLVEFVCGEGPKQLFINDPDLPLGRVSDAIDIDLDGAYEGHPDIKRVPKHVLMAGKAGLVSASNLTPEIRLTDEEKGAAKRKLDGFPRPWIMICPKSNSFTVRTVPDDIWSKVPDDRTWIWAGTHEKPSSFKGVRWDGLREFSALMSCCDVIVSVDTGPLHIGAAVGTPCIAIGQACSPELHLTDQRDFRVINADLECLNCHLPICPIDASSPPCGRVDPDLIRETVNSALDARYGDRVSAIIPVYNPDVRRLDKCITLALRYVDEIIVAIDGDGKKPASGFTDHPKIKWISNPTEKRRGYGKTCNMGARHSSGRFLLFINDDVFLQWDTVSKMKSACKSGVGAVGCLLRYPDGTIQHGGTVRHLECGFGHIDWGKTVPSVTATTEMENVTHACVLIRREAFYDVLGYDERFDMYWEDNDLNMKLRQKGWKIMYEPKAWAIHEEHKTTDAFNAENMAKASKPLFSDKWLWYFKKNPNNGLGKFK